MSDFVAPSEVARPVRALPFWMSLCLVPFAVVAAGYGGWTVLLLPLVSWVLFGVLDAIVGASTENADPSTPETGLAWYRAITLIWFPVQFLLVFGLIWYVPDAEHLSRAERLWIFFGVGVIAGTVGINYSHELMHQPSRLERWLADLLLASVLYSHFRSEHLRVHHQHVGTPRDTVTARYNEGFHRFFPRVLRQSPVSAWKAETSLLARRALPAWHWANPFWRYAGLQLTMLMLALALGGWIGLGLFLWQAFVAVYHLEVVNYIEHYGLTRRYLGNGRYEQAKPRHSWNSAMRTSNWLLINLQRHSDHHAKPARRFPLLQSYAEPDAPQLPYGYPVMAFLATIPPLWKRVMNRRVKAWRRRHYPDIADWKPYNKATNPVVSD